jgi:hypothetical protein
MMYNKFGRRGGWSIDEAGADAMKAAAAAVC